MGKKPILMADDEAGLTRVLKRNLEQTGRYEVLSVAGEQEAIDAARHFRPDLVLLDVVMSAPLDLRTLMQQLEEQLEKNRQ